MSLLAVGWHFSGTARVLTYICTLVEQDYCGLPKRSILRSLRITRLRGPSEKQKEKSQRDRRSG